MPLLFTTQQSVFESKDGTKKWHPRLVKIGKPVTTYEIAAEMAKRSSLTPGDALNVIDNMMDIIQSKLLDSRSVCLDRLGTFTVTCRSTGNGVDNEEDVNAGQISDLKVRFTPTYTVNKFQGTTRAMFMGAAFEKYERKKTKKKEEEGGNENPGGGNIDPDA